MFFSFSVSELNLREEKQSVKFFSLNRLQKLTAKV